MTLAESREIVDPELTRISLRSNANGILQLMEDELFAEWPSNHALNFWEIWVRLLVATRIVLEEDNTP